MPQHLFVRVLLIAIALSSVAGAQDAPVAATTSVSKWSEFESQVDRLFRGSSRAGHPGAVVLVARGDEFLVAKGYGLADLERNVPLTEDSVLDIGSTSKQFTATCLLLLANDGDLKLDDSVRKHIKELPACCEPVTLRHMMLHTSGLPDYIGLLMAGGQHVENRTTMEDALESLLTIDKLDFAAGTGWAYSNSNYMPVSYTHLTLPTSDLV